MWLDDDRGGASGSAPLDPFGENLSSCWILHPDSSTSDSVSDDLRVVGHDSNVDLNGLGLDVRLDLPDDNKPSDRSYQFHCVSPS